MPLLKEKSSKPSKNVFNPSILGKPSIGFNPTLNDDDDDGGKKISSLESRRRKFNPMKKQIDKKKKDDRSDDDDGDNNKEEDDDDDAIMIDEAHLPPSWRSPKQAQMKGGAIISTKPSSVPVKYETRYGTNNKSTNSTNDPTLSSNVVNTDQIQRIFETQFNKIETYFNKLSENIKITSSDTGDNITEVKALLISQEAKLKILQEQYQLIQDQYQLIQDQCRLIQDQRSDLWTVLQGFDESKPGEWTYIISTDPKRYPIDENDKIYPSIVDLVKGSLQIDNVTEHR